MTTPFLIYTIAWITVCMLAVYLGFRHSQQVELLQARYWRFLLQRWKVLSFAVAGSGMTVIAPYTGDPTWDYVDAGFMSVLTFITAHWVVGILYRALTGRGDWIKTYLAICLWMFSASWSYDLYLVIRDGSYPMTWLPNILASSVLYVSARLLWSLEWRQDRGVAFGFTEQGWPEASTAQRTDKIFWPAMPLVLFVVALMIPFFL